MNEKIIIGKKATRKSIIANFIAFIFYGLIGGIGTYGLLKFVSNLNNNVCVYIGIIAFIATMLIVVPLAVITDYIEINQTSLTNHSYNNYLQMLLETFLILLGKKQQNKNSINLNDIKNVELSYETFHMLWAQKGYKIRLKFNLKNNSIITIYPSGHNHIKNRDYEKLFVLLENKSIPIIDKYNLRPVLKTTPSNLVNYIKNNEINKK